MSERVAAVEERSWRWVRGKQAHVKELNLKFGCCNFEMGGTGVFFPVEEIALPAAR